MKTEIAKTFEVTITRDVRMRFTAEVEAVDDRDAIDIATAFADGSNAQWAEGDILDENTRVRQISGDTSGDTK